MGPRSSKRFSGKRKRLFFLGAVIQGRGEVPSRAPWSPVAGVSHQAEARMETVMQATMGLRVPAGLRDALPGAELTQPSPGPEPRASPDPPSRSSSTPAFQSSIYSFLFCVLSHFSRVRLFATPWTVAHQTLLSMGFSRQEYWSGLPCPPPGDLPNPEVKPMCLTSAALVGEVFFLPLGSPGKPFLCLF